MIFFNKDEIMKLTRIAFPVLLLCLANAWADTTPLTYDRISLAVTAGEDVENDTLISLMYAQKEGNDPSRLATEVNRLIKNAIEMAKGESAVKVQTMEYNTSPVYRNQVLSGWRVRQSIRLESRDAAALSNLIGRLQADLGVGSISYAVSPERRRGAENELVKSAIADFRQRADMVTEQMGRSGYRLVQMNVNTSGLGPIPVARSSRGMMMAAEAPPPALEAGTRRVEVRVDGTIELKP
jgi:predicted secreted protein